MSYKIAAIGDLDTVVGFGLAGVAQTHVHRNADETVAKLTEIFSDPEIGLVLITHRVSEELKKEIRKLMSEKRHTLLVLRIPDKTGFTPKEDELKEIIKRTVGADIVLNKERS